MRRQQQRGFSSAWQCAKIGALWQLDATPHRWWPDRPQAEPPPSLAAAAPVRGSLEEKIATLRKRQQCYQEALAALEESGGTKVSLTDPESRRMRKAGVGYNGQIAVDAKHKLSAVADVVNEPTDHPEEAEWPLAA